MADPSTYTTPTKRAIINAEAGPSRIKPSGASPAYSSRRHSLYGVEDRIIIDPGCRIWKVGFSGETDPRAVFPTNATDEDEGAWELDLDTVQCARGNRKEARRIISQRISMLMRDTYRTHLMTDPKARKVIILENTFLPQFVKEEIAKSLFEDLKVPSVSFSSSNLTSLVACGKITGLVVDVGWSETTVTPVFHSRPLFHHSQSSTLSSKSIHKRLKSLLLNHARYYPPPESLSNLKRRAKAIPNDLFTTEVIEKILRQGCFASEPIKAPLPPRTSEPIPNEWEDRDLMDRLKERYKANSNASDLKVPISPRKGENQDMGPAILVVPGWIRERAVEAIFGDHETEERSIHDLILETILKLSIDLRGLMISDILITGYTASLSGFIHRLRTELLNHLTPPSPSASTELAQPLDSTAPIDTPEYRKAETANWKKRHQEPYKLLYPLKKKLSILNDPSPSDGGEEGKKGGSAPRWVPGLISWVGGSLAGALRTGGPEILREDYDTAVALHSEKGEAFMKLLEAQSAQTGLPEQESGQLENVNPVQKSLVTSGRIHEGVRIEDLLPGMAVSGTNRKRGWKNEVNLGDWTRIVKV